MFQTSASLSLVAFVAVAIASLFSGTSAETSPFEVCFEFDPPLEPASEGEELTFGSCFIDAYNTDNLPRGFKMDSVEFVFEDDDTDDGRRNLGKNKKKAKKAKGKGNCNGSGCGSEAGNIYEESCSGGCRRNLHQSEEEKFSFRGAASRMLGRVLGTTSDTTTKSHTELLLDDCVLYAYAQSGVLVPQATYGVSLAPCSS